MSVLTEKADLEEVKQWDFVDVWDQESYERIKEYGKNFFCYMATGTLLCRFSILTNSGGFSYGKSAA